MKTARPNLGSKDDRIRQLEAALEFYADPGDYQAPFTGGMGKLWSDGGTIARVALGEPFHGDTERAALTNTTPYQL